jgi:hypothetical protein
MKAKREDKLIINFDYRKKISLDFVGGKFKDEMKK